MIFHIFNRTILSVTTSESVICITAFISFTEGKCLPKGGRCLGLLGTTVGKVQASISPNRQGPSLCLPCSSHNGVSY